MECGTTVVGSERIEYLGAVLDAKGDVSGELCQRVGLAKADFWGALQSMAEISVIVSRKG